jgi:trimeric autotransporter adhesin
MTSNNQVSPVIRISRGERDASARATHLKAASRKYLETTIERKQMSTTTNFKRIALVAVAALGLGVLSSVPSQATINSDSVTLSSASAAQTTAETFTATSAVATVSFFGAIGDSMTLTAALVSAPAGNTAMPVLRLIETTSAVIDTAIVLGGAGGGATSPAGGRAVGYPTLANTATNVSAYSSSVTTVARYAVYLATSGAATAAPTTVGAYVVRLTPAAVGVGPLVGATAQNLTITVTAAAALDTVPSAANSISRMYAGEPAADLFTAATADSVVTTVRTINASVPAATINAVLRNAANTTAAVDSITATITGPGQLGSSGTPSGTTASGRSITVKQGDFVSVFSDGVAGTATITLTSFTAGVAIGTPKTVTFTSTTATSYAAPTIAATDSSVILAGAATTVSVFAKEGTNNVSGLTTASAAGGTTIWAYSSDTAVATVGTVGAFDALTGYSVVVTGVAVGTANISFGNAATRAAATIVSPTVAVRVGTDVASNVTVTLDKSTYAPGEKMTMTVTILNAAGLPVVGKTSYANIFSSTGVTSSMNLASGTLPAANIADYSNTSNTKTFTLFAPVTGGNLTFSWTGGTGLATANQVARTTSVTVADSGAAALAAVTALATTVASLRTLIVTLTNLVLKIQKKVRA